MGVPPAAGAEPELARVAGWLPNTPSPRIQQTVWVVPGTGGQGVAVSGKFSLNMPGLEGRF